jgi:hypothetical protein
VPPLGVCEKCGEPVNSKLDAAYPVSGWEVLREQGGANAIRNRERVGNRIRHVRCIPDPRVNEAQEAMAL